MISYHLPTTIRTTATTTTSSTVQKPCNRPISSLRSSLKTTSTSLYQSNEKNNSNDNNNKDDIFNRIKFVATSQNSRSLTFSALMVACGAALGPFLDSYHSTFGVLQYNRPFESILWGTAAHPALITTWWVPPLFGLAGFIIGWLYILLDAVFAVPKDDGQQTSNKTWPVVFIGISLFTFQYWLSGVLFAMSIPRTTIFIIMSLVSMFGFQMLDGTTSGFITSIATAMGGPLIEVGLLSTLTEDGYHYVDSGETGFFPLWILPVYFLGGPAVGNLARAIWNQLSWSSSPEGNTINNES